MQKGRVKRKINNQSFKNILMDIYETVYEYDADYNLDADRCQQRIDSFKSRVMDKIKCYLDIDK